MATKKGVALASVTLEGAPMNNTQLISVIVPVFNAQRFLPKCIGSILNQSYKNLEVLLIDDGSTDKSLEICKKYEQKDSRVVVISQENGGVSSARNNGLRRANGEYICFVDSDDWIPKKSIELLYRAILVEDSDLAVGALKSIEKARTFISTVPNEVINIEKDKEEFLMFVKQMERAPFAKLYKKSILSEYSLQFPKGIAWGEDTIFVCNYLEKCKSIRLISNVVYIYNMFNYTSATYKSYLDHGEWCIQIVDSFAKVCSHVNLPLAREIASQNAKFYLIKAVYNYVSCNLNRDEAIKKIKSVYNGMQQYILDNQSDVDSGVCEDTIPYYLSKESGAELVYDELKRVEASAERPASNRIEEFIKRALVRIKYVWFFDLKL